MNLNFNILLFLAVIFTVFSCKKKKTTKDDGSNGINICSTFMSTIIVNDTVYNIINDTGYATMNNTFYSDHQVAEGFGCSIDSKGSTHPLAGTYNITPIYSEVASGLNNVFIQFFKNGKTYFGQNGQLIVTGSGNIAIRELCKVEFREPFGESVILSLKSDAE